MSDPKTMNCREVAEVFGVSEWTVKRAVRAGTFPIKPYRIGRLLRWSRAAVMAALADD